MAAKTQPWASPPQPPKEKKKWAAPMPRTFAQDVESAQEYMARVARELAAAGRAVNNYVVKPTASAVTNMAVIAATPMVNAGVQAFETAQPIIGAADQNC